MSAAQGVKVWRPKRASTLGVSVVALFMAGMWLSLLGTAAANGVGDVIVLGVIMLGPAVLLLGFVVRCRIVVDGRQLKIRNLIREHSYPLDDVVEVTPGYWGLTFLFVDGTRQLAMASQKSNAAVALHASTRSDRIAAEINELAAGS